MKEALIKSLIILTLVTVFIMSATACGNNPTSENQSTAQPSSIIKSTADDNSTKVGYAHNPIKNETTKAIEKCVANRL